MAFISPVFRVLPDGVESVVFPFHMSLEGLEKNVICRDDEDCDTMVKSLCLCARRKNVIIIIYAVASNHAHAAVLARNREAVVAFGQEVKRNYSCKFKNRYGENKVLRHTSVDVRAVDTVWYLRNVLAYIPKNAFDNGATNLNDYKWTGFRAMFSRRDNTHSKKVSELQKREKEKIMRTGDDLGKVQWTLNANDELEPESFCDVAYLEQAYNNDHTFFLKCIGNVNLAEMTQKTVIAPRAGLTDAQLVKEVSNLSNSWYGQEVQCLSSEKKARLLQYVKRNIKCGVPQLARVFGIDRSLVERLLGKM